MCAGLSWVQARDVAAYACRAIKVVAVVGNAPNTWH
jgi:hypothetical protein